VAADTLGIRPELHVPGTGAHTRVTSTGHVWPIKTAVIRHGRSFTAPPRKVSGTKMLRKSSEFGGYLK
jgi:hypothetical protein